MLDIFFDLLGYAIVAPFAYPYYKLFKLTKSIDASFQMPRSNAKRLCCDSVLSCLLNIIISNRVE